MSEPTRSVAAVFPGRDELDALLQRRYNATVTSFGCTTRRIGDVHYEDYWKGS